MINVIAAIRVKPGMLPNFIEIFNDIVSIVRKENGCIEYFPAVDVDAELQPQILDENVVTVIEKWESLQALNDHINSAHMMSYKNRVKDIVEDMTIKVLKEI